MISLNLPMFICYICCIKCIDKYVITVNLQSNKSKALGNALDMHIAMQARIVLTVCPNYILVLVSITLESVRNIVDLNFQV